MIEGVREKIVIGVSIERRLEVDGSDIMQKIIIQDIIPVGDIESVIDKLREMLKQAEQNTFTFL